MLHGYLIFKLRERNKELKKCKGRLKKYSKVTDEMLSFCNSFVSLKEGYFEDIDEDILLTDAFNSILEKLEDYDGITCNTNDLLFITGNDVILTLRLFENNYIVKQVNYLKEKFFIDVQEGDKILRINGINCCKLKIPDMIDIIKCLEKSNENIRLCLERNSVKKEVVIEAKKDDISNIVAKEFNINDKAIKYIKLSLFDENSAEEFENELLQLEYDIDSLIIDLRNHIGGIKTELIDIISLFLDDDNVIFREENQGFITLEKSKGNENKEYQIVILINSISSWCSEIVTSALMEKCGAISIGTTTSGQGMITGVSTSNSEESNYNFYIPTAKWYTTKGICTHNKGIVPTINVEYKQDKDGMDSQLKAALEYLSNR